MPTASVASSGPGVRETVARLRSHQKSSKGAPAYSRFVNRPIGRWFAALAYCAGWTPNQVTALSAAFSFAGIAVVLLVPTSLAAGVAVTVLLVVGYALDSADGQLARLRGGGSPAGEWLDHIVDAAKITSLHVAVLVGLHRVFGSGVQLVVPLVALLVANLMFFTFILTDQILRRSGAGGLAPAAPTGASTAAPVLRSLLVLPTDYGLLCLVFLLWGAPSAFLLVYGLLMAGTLGYLALGLPKWFRDVGGSRPA